MPGVKDVSSITVTIEPPDTVTVLVPDRYHLQLHLSVPIGPHADSVRFKRRTGKLAMLCTVLSDSEAAAAAAAAAASAASAATQQKRAKAAAAETGSQQDPLHGEPQDAAQHVQHVQQTSRQQQPAGNSSSAHAPQQQQQQQQDTPTGSQQQQQQAPGGQQQAVKLDSDLPPQLKSIEEMFSRKHSPTLVGCCATVFDTLTVTAVRLGLGLAQWAEGVLVEDVPCGIYSGAVLCVLWCVGAALAFLAAIPQIVWRTAWTIPLQVITAALVVFGPEAPTTHDEMGRVAGAACNAARAQLEEDDSLRAGLTKLLLVGVSAAVVWGGVWATCVWQLGTTHSLGGWLLAALLLVWRAALWVWRLLVWRPPSWYPAQLLFGGMATVSCLDTQADGTHSGGCRLAMLPLQIIITGGGWAMVCSLAVSVMWHMATSWHITLSDILTVAAAGKATGSHFAVYWWPAAAAGMLPTVARSWLLGISRWGPAHAALRSVGAGVQAAVVLLAGALGGTLSSLQAGLQLLTVACCNSLAHVTPGLLQLLFGAVAAWVTGVAGRLGWWCAQRAAGAVMGVLCWCAPAWYVGLLVQQACAASGDWQEGCMALLGPHAAQAPDSLSLPHSWWFTVLLHVWLGCVFRQLVAWRAGVGSGRWLQEEQQLRLEAARQRRDHKLQQRKRQKKKHEHN